MLPREEGSGSTVDLTVNAISVAKSRYPDLRGQGVVICLKEQSPDPANIDLRGRLLPSSLASPGSTPHATQMATILLGAGNSSPLAEGIAPQASLISVGFGDLLPASDAFYGSNHVTVVNHSYGTVIEPFYGAEAAAYDGSTSRLPTLLYVFSAGNVGYSRSLTGTYANLPTVATLTGNAKMAKNNLVVGDIGLDGKLQASSSRGPAYDGRIKPELVAYSDEGSSGAAAVASGVAALLQQAVRQQTNADVPAALIKAVLINAADDVGTKGPDYQTGYGSINAYQAVETIREKRYLTGSVATNTPVDLTIQVPAARRLTITLAWSDAPAEPNSPQALVNDLDLTVSDGHTTWLPWVLNALPSLDSLNKEAVRRRDTLNNVEQITLDVPAPGRYTIRVRGARLHTGNQPFALAYQWEPPNTFYWTTPVANVPVRSDTAVTIRWKNTTSATYGTLEFTADRGQTWRRVQANVALAAGELTWQTPDALTPGQLRMRIADSVYVSDSFVLSPVPVINSLYACGDSLGITWLTVVGKQPVALHQLYKLAGQSATWLPVGLLTGNRIVLRGVQPDDLWAVAPVSPVGVTGIRSEAINRQQVACYYQSLTADLVNNVVAIRCELSTTEGVKTIAYQKQTVRGELLALGTQPVMPRQLAYTLTDNLLQEGPNTYRIRIALENGAVLYSDFVTAYAIREKPFLLYPNPVSSGQVLIIRASEPGLYRFRLVDEMGRSVRDIALAGSEAMVPTAGLSAGNYGYTIYSESQVIQTGKLLVK